MNKEFKKIIVKLSRLPQSDQRWVLKQLTVQQLDRFKKLRGETLLHDAQRFRKLACPELLQIKQDPQLPAACKELKQQDPLYIAIILEQGKFSWSQEFLLSCPQQHEIKQQINNQVHHLKPATKFYVFQQWQSQLSFNDQLETRHG